MSVISLTGKIKSVFQLIRLPNILIIILTQFLLRYCILNTFLYPSEPGAITGMIDFSILVLITVLIAMGGYVINDYFDIKIDSVNKPDKLVVNRLISPRGAIKLHITLNAVAIILGFYLAYRIRVFSFGLIFPFLTGVLWLYSAKYKRVLLWGNIIVSLLSGFVILIVWLFEFFWLRLNPDLFSSGLPEIRWVTKAFLAYSLFAFLVSFFREVIKDIEDARGDETCGCRTLPLVVGVEKSRWIAGIIIFATILLLAYGQLVVYRLGWQMVFWYFMVAVQLPALYLLYSLVKAKVKSDYHFLSLLCKLIMVAGILSMQLISIST